MLLGRACLKIIRISFFFAKIMQWHTKLPWWAQSEYFFVGVKLENLVEKIKLFFLEILSALNNFAQLNQNFTNFIFEVNRNLKLEANFICYQKLFGSKQKLWMNLKLNAKLVIFLQDVEFQQKIKYITEFSSRNNRNRIFEAAQQ